MTLEGTAGGGPRRGQRNALVRQPPLNLKFLVAARIKLTLQQATIRVLSPAPTGEAGFGVSCQPSPQPPSLRHDASPSPWLIAPFPSAHILHLITFLKYDPPDGLSDRLFFSPLPPLSRLGATVARRPPFYMQNFTGRGSETATRVANELHRGK